ncbi:signal peptidase I [Methanosarcina sp. DH2]|jgi:signal peptidase|uniref:signal peptidase I n=1 Tax=Methanosarcina sp. DH2 TaxID=2605639 RepID=UPI001E3DEA2D|nr:signal peptidase I [Methanosarcina sp. DH2]MCC4771430.1 signal peptidase I [Methanosarcina sp. DH2]
MKIIENFISTLLIIVIIPILSTIIPTGSVQLMTVTGSSMEPTITASDIIVVDTTETQPVVGDIVSYHHTFEENERLIVTHRIVGIEKGSYRTKGDAYTEPDDYMVSPEDVVGIMLFKIPYFGSLIHFAGTSKGFLILVIFPASILIIQELLEIMGSMRR